MSKANDGGPAFPVDNAAMDGQGGVWKHAVGLTGMTLRDWFAGQALPEMMEVTKAEAAKSAEKDETSSQWIARMAYVMADAMLAERDKANAQEGRG